MANQQIRNNFKVNINRALQAFAATTDIDHQPTKGAIREILAKELLEPILPPGVEIGHSGIIVDAAGGQSKETDLIIFARQILPQILYGREIGFYPVEACLYAVEVKSKLTATEIKDSVKKARHLMKLRYTPTLFPHNPITPIGPIAARALPVIFAFSSDLSKDGKSELERYREIDKNADTTPTIGIICIPAKGYWWFSGKSWEYSEPTTEFDEVINFIGGVANSIPEMILQRGLPHFGHYLIQSL